jgi:hypothetical protein
MGCLSTSYYQADNENDCSNQADTSTDDANDDSCRDGWGNFLGSLIIWIVVDACWGSRRAISKEIAAIELAVKVTTVGAIGHKLYKICQRDLI